MKILNFFFVVTWYNNTQQRTLYNTRIEEKLISRNGKDIYAD